MRLEGDGTKKRKSEKKGEIKLGPTQATMDSYLS